MAALPATKYATTSDGVNIAYQVIGDGDVDLVLVEGFVSHVDQAWEDPHHTSFFRLLSRFSRLIRFDKRGSGVSDRTDRAPTLEDRMEDLLAVLDAVGSKQAVLFGVS